jgi:DNA invertase Pin-like site-specific DNA recombinase
MNKTISKTQRPEPRASVKLVRCAIYTRKSTEEGLEKEFNSLDAQRESGEAFVRSQAGEGWALLNNRYDEGGFTGGNTDRPALRRLLADIEAGKIDGVVVYKVDRLSRSLLDFAQMMQTFEKHNVAFVSVTQQFNTGTSMGRLVLNVLLSFAQFEREIISERTRDKIAATRRKGKWSGGHPILGYDVDPNGFKLTVNTAEAERVRAIFALYLEHESLLPVVQELTKRQWFGKRWQTRKGIDCGGEGFTRWCQWYPQHHLQPTSRGCSLGCRCHRGFRRAVVKRDRVTVRPGTTHGTRCNDLACAAVAPSGADRCRWCGGNHVLYIEEVIVETHEEAQMWLAKNGERA